MPAKEGATLTPFIKNRTGLSTVLYAPSGTAMPAGIAGIVGPKPTPKSSMVSPTRTGFVG